MFGFQKRVHSLGAEFAAPDALLHAAERTIARRRHAVVDAERAGFEAIPSAGMIA